MTSPTLAAQIAGVLATFPQAKWVSWEPAGRDNTRAGAVLAFGEPVEAQYRFDQADVILSLEADFVGSHPASLRLVREFASRRKVDGAKPEMNRLYVVEGSPTSTGACRRPSPGAAQLRDRGLRPRGGGRPRRPGRGRRRRTPGPPRS